MNTMRFINDFAHKFGDCKKMDSNQKVLIFKLVGIVIFCIDLNLQDIFRSL